MIKGVIKLAQASPWLFGCVRLHIDWQQCFLGLKKKKNSWLSFPESSVPCIKSPFSMIFIPKAMHNNPVTSLQAMELKVLNIYIHQIHSIFVQISRTMMDLIQPWPSCRWPWRLEKVYFVKSVRVFHVYEEKNVTITNSELFFFFKRVQMICYHTVCSFNVHVEILTKRHENKKV